MNIEGQMIPLPIHPRLAIQQDSEYNKRREESDSTEMKANKVFFFFA